MGCIFSQNKVEVYSDPNERFLIIFHPDLTEEEGKVIREVSRDELDTTYKDLKDDPDFMKIIPIDDNDGINLDAIREGEFTRVNKTFSSLQR